MTLSPLLILALGIAIVLGMILVLRVNAFLALLTAAIVVSLLAPGETAGKIDRVAVAFGGAAKNIGIVIALAAVIGQCMMDSGAADRVVRAFLRLLGVKRSPWALLGSGYVLAIPVFFDTVFYLLVPLARSFYRRTGGQYLRCLLAIAAGGAVTHTMVPPTPGPLTIAANLDIDLGVMIGVGALVALPSAVVGLLFGSVLDRMMPVPMRPLSDRPDVEPLPDSALP
ncbi:MAG TPA: SLC13 family permease, partial [Planctomycetaceae bacterium]